VKERGNAPGKIAPQLLRRCLKSHRSIKVTYEEMRILKQHTAALVIDIQEKLFPVMTDKEELLANCLKLVKGLQILGIPLLVTQQYTKGLGETIPEISSEIKDFVFIEKRDFSCCREPAVLNKLRELEAGNIIICGIESHVCVLQTALDLKEGGFNPVIVMDAVSSRHPASLDLAIERFRYESIMMTSTESLLFELIRSSAAPEFKEISMLVK
jgi:nicotinamidase-related amidase